MTVLLTEYSFLLPVAKFATVSNLQLEYIYCQLTAISDAGEYSENCLTMQVGP